MEKSIAIKKTKIFVQDSLQGAEGGHDRWHIYRVWKSAIHIGRLEYANVYIVELGALLHDIADSKFHSGDEEKGPKIATAFLRSLRQPDSVINQVEHIIRYISFKGGKNIAPYISKELAVVQDADRIDAIGAIGIARTFNYGGYTGRSLYDPSITPNLRMSKGEYKTNTAPTINHFYEKLLLLKNKMNTDTGKQLAAQRHQFMISFLDQFYAEREGQK